MPRKQSLSGAASGASTPAIQSFESEFERLTSIVDRLEAGNVPLDEMLGLYEEGMTLSTRLKDVLSEAELRVEKLARIHEEKVDPGSRVEVLEEDDDEGEQDELLF